MACFQDWLVVNDLHLVFVWAGVLEML